jgi:Skp family chaperone for outer membrane proteins
MKRRFPIRGGGFAVGLGLVITLSAMPRIAWPVEIPLEGLAPVRIGYVDLQKVFDTFPEKAFAEGDLLKEIEKRKKNLDQRQMEINSLRQQIASDQTALEQARSGRPVMVPQNLVALTPPPAPPAPPPVKSTTTVTASTATVVPSTATVEPYPTEEPLAGLPGHEAAASASNAASGNNNLSGLQAQSSQEPTQGPSSPLLDLLAGATAPVLLNTEATSALQKRIDDDRKLLDQKTFEFKNFRSLAVADMKALQTQKTYGVMSKIYAVLQGLARDENIMVVLDKSYVLYGEDSVDLTDKLISMLNEPEANPS